MARIIRQALLLVVLSAILGLVVNLPLVKRYVQGEFRHSFLSSEQYPSISFITLEEAEELFSGGEALFIDSRLEEQFFSGHIFGAVNIPIERVNRGEHTAIETISRDRTLVVYCDGRECQSSVELARRLHDRGFSDIRIFFGGWAEWLGEGLPVSAENDS